MEEKDVLVDGIVEDEADPLVDVAAYRGQGSRGRLVARRWHSIRFFNCLLSSPPFSFFCVDGEGEEGRKCILVGINVYM